MTPDKGFGSLIIMQQLCAEASSKKMHLPASRRRQTLPEKLSSQIGDRRRGLMEPRWEEKKKHEPDAFDGLACEIFGFT